MQGRVAMVTGGATGLGRAACLEFAQRGAAIAFNYVDLPRTRRHRTSPPPRRRSKRWRTGVLQPLHVRDHAQSRTSSPKRASVGRHSLSGQQRGVAHDGALWRLSPDAWKEVMDTNVTALSIVSSRGAAPARATLRQDRQRGEHQAFRPGFGIANYAASKAALIGLTSRRGRSRSSNINVNAVARASSRPSCSPSCRAKCWSGRSANQAGRVAEPEDVAKVIVSCAASGAAHHRANDRRGRRLTLA